MIDSSLEARERGAEAPVLKFDTKGYFVAEYEIQFYSLSRYAMVIYQDEAEMISRFIRGLPFRIREVMFAVAQSGAFIQRIVESTKEFVLMHREEYRDLRDKRSHISSRFSSTSSGGRGSFKLDFFHQHGRTD